MFRLEKSLLKMTDYCQLLMQKMHSLLILKMFFHHLVTCLTLLGHQYRADDEDCQGAVPSKYHRPSKAIEKYEEYEWIKDDYPIINNWPTFSFYDNESCRKPKIRVRCQYVLNRYLVYLKDNRRPKNTYKRVLFNNEGWALITAVIPRFPMLKLVRRAG